MVKVAKMLRAIVGQSKPTRLDQRSSPATISHAVDRYMTWLIGTLAIDNPAAMTLDCRGDAVLIRSLVNGNWFEVIPLTNGVLSGIIKGKSTKIEATPTFWDFFVRMHAGATSISTENFDERMTTFAGHHLALRLDSFDAGRGIVHLRLLENDAE